MIIKLLLATVAGGATLFATRGHRRKGKSPARLRQGGVLEAMDRRRSGDPQAKANREILAASASLVVAGAAAVLHSGAGVLVLPLFLYFRWPYFREAFALLWAQRRAGQALIDCLIWTILAFTGQWVVLSVIWWILTVAGKLVLLTEDHSHRHLADVFDIGVETVWVWRDGVEVEIPFAELHTKDVVVVRAGEVIPADGVVVEGSGAVDQCLLTGEAQPRECQIGDEVLASSTLLTGRLRFRVGASGSQTTAGRIAQALEESADYRMELQWQWAERLDHIVPYCLAVGAASWVLIGPMSAVLISYATAGIGWGMRIVAPLQLFKYLRHSSKSLMLVKDGRVFEQLRNIDTVVFDKTGTLTQEQPHVEQVHCFGDLSAEHVLTLGASAEQRQSHPIAQAILAKAAQQGLTLSEVQGGRYELGLGILAELSDGREVAVGSTRYLTSKGISLTKRQTAIETRCHEHGGTLVWVLVDEQLIGAIELLPTLRPEARQVVQQLRAMGVHCCVLSGDREAPTRYLAGSLGIDGWFAEVLPDGKASVIESLQQQGCQVCYVGDGINDSLALRQADVSVSLAGASSIAVDTAQVVMTDRGLTRLPLLLQSGRAFERSMQRSHLITSVLPVLAVGGVLAGVMSILKITVMVDLGMAMGAVHAAQAPALPKPSRLTT